MGNRLLAQFPAEQYRASIDYARKIEQADVEVFDLNADGIDLGKGILYPLYGLLALGLASGEMHDVQERATIKEDAMGNFLQLGIDGFD